MCMKPICWADWTPYIVHLEYFVIVSKVFESLPIYRAHSDDFGQTADAQADLSLHFYAYV